MMGGTANLTRFGQDYSVTMGPVLEALEEHVVLLRLLQEVDSHDDLTVRIGAENEVVGLSTSAVVTTGYGPARTASRISGCSARRVWTTRARWGQCARLRATSAAS